MKGLPIGISDFDKLITKDYYYVDKSLFIKDVIEDGSEVILFTRPRRFGKTLNMTMLKAFLEKSDIEKGQLFNGLKVTKHEDIMQHQGKYPVIFLTFKSMKEDNYSSAIKNMGLLIAEEFQRHKYLLNSDVLDNIDKKNFLEIAESRADRTLLEKSIKYLSHYLYNHHKVKPFILIDEYDTPLETAFTNDYFTRLVNFIRILLNEALKDNCFIQKGILTGCFRVSKESIFSDLNNINVDSLLNHEYPSYFGLTEDEVNEIFKYYKFDCDMDEIKKWYNGYIFGANVTIFNPWSIINRINKKSYGNQAYWVNTSSNDLIKKSIKASIKGIRDDLDTLIKGGFIKKQIKEEIIISDIGSNSGEIWSLLLFSGYLKAYDMDQIGAKRYYKLAIPNEEVKSVYDSIVNGWFNELFVSTSIDDLKRCLLSGDVNKLNKVLKYYISNSFSYFDVSESEPEVIYHVFMLGLFVTLSDIYEVKSNRESGDGRYDMCLIPRELDKCGLVFEFKQVDDAKDLEKAAKDALDQAIASKYCQELTYRRVNKILEVGIGFCGKNFSLVSRVNS